MRPAEQKNEESAQPKTKGLHMVIEEKQAVQLQPQLLTRQSLPLTSQNLALQKP
jgi:hypothetical protein